MFLGALLDLGLPLDGLRAALGSLAIEYGSVSAERVLRAGVSATKFRVHESAPTAVAASAEKPWSRRLPCVTPITTPMVTDTITTAITRTITIRSTGTDQGRTTDRITA